MRIISLVPSITELLCDLGLEQQLVGITKFCVRPSHLLRQIPHIGGTKTLRIEAIRKLQPDLVIANKEENLQDQVEQIGQFARLLVTDIPNYQAAIKMIQTVGDVTNSSRAATKLLKKIEQAQITFQKQLPLSNVKPSVIYLIWQRPFMSIGGDTFAHSMLELAGFRNVFMDRLRYPEIMDDELQKASPEYIFLSSEPFPFKEKHVRKIKEICPEARVVLVDGEAFTWYGSRMCAVFDYFLRLQQQLKTH